MKSRLVGKYVALLSAAEVGLGSLLHALHVPMAGHFLSLNQGLILLFAAKRAGGRREAVEAVSAISTVSAFLKAFSPAGKKLTPMLAIALQGALFATGIAALGRNVIGAAIGMALLALWGFVQPLLVAWVLFGGVLFESILAGWHELCRALSLPPESGLWIVLVAVGGKVVLGALLAGCVWRAEESAERAYADLVERWRHRFPRPRRAEGGAVRSALRDLLSPWFVTSLGASVAFVVLSGRAETESIWVYVLRPVAGGFVFFYCVRAIPFDRIAYLKQFR